MLADPVGRERSAPAALGRIEQSGTGAQRRRQHLVLARQLGGRAIDIGQKVAVAGIAPGDIGLDRPALGRAQRALDIDGLVALLADRAQHRDAAGRGLNRLVVEVDEETVDVELRHAAQRIGLEARHEAALGLGLEQAAALGPGLGIGAKIDLRRLEGVAHAGMQSQRVDRAFRGLPGLPLRAQRAAEAVDVLDGRCGRHHASAVDAGFVAGFMRGVPAQPGQQAGAGRQLITALGVHAPEAAAVVEIDGALGVDRFDVRRLADAVEQQPEAIAQAVRVGAAQQQVDAGRQVQPVRQLCGEVAVDEQLAQA